jgi:hypothetical protein
MEKDPGSFPCAPFMAKAKAKREHDGRQKRGRKNESVKQASGCYLEVSIV